MPLEIERKFLLSTVPDLTDPLLAGAEVKRIHQTYLAVDTPARVRVRRVVSADEAVSFWHTTKHKVGPGIRDEVEAEITSAEYEALLALKDPKRHTVVKDRYVFGFDGNVFELDHVTSPRELWLLEVELSAVEDLTAPISLPLGVALDDEVTGKKGFSNAAIAKSR